MSSVTLIALVDDKQVSFKLPYNDITILAVDNLVVGWHIVSLKIAAVNKTINEDNGPGSGLSEGTEVPITTGIAEQDDGVPISITAAASPGTVALDRVVFETGLSE